MKPSRHATKTRKTRDSLRAALNRIFLGEPTRAPHALDILNVAKEAGVSRATLYRYPDVVAEFDARKKDLQSKPDPTLPEEINRRLKVQLQELRAKSSARIRELEDLTDVLAQQVQFQAIQLTRRADTQRDQRLTPISIRRKTQ